MWCWFFRFSFFEKYEIFLMKFLVNVRFRIDVFVWWIYLFIGTTFGVQKLFILYLRVHSERLAKQIWQNIFSTSSILL